MTTVRPILAFAAISVLAGCPKNVPQESHSGPDARAKGAKKVKLEEGEGASKGVVTYPGGDRVDWKVFEVAQKGDLTVSLKWKPPRDGLDLSFNILDETLNPVPEGKAKPAKKGSTKTKKTVKLKDVDPGKYFVQVYASERGDAGAYTLNVSWKEGDGGGGGGGGGDDIPFPPRLASVPEPVAAAPPGGPGETPPGGTPPGGTPPGGTPPGGTPPVKAAKPIKAGITEMTMSGSDLLIILDKGKNSGVDAKWTGQILRGTTDKLLTKSEYDLIIIRVTDDEATAKVLKLSMDQIGDNKKVLLKAPAPVE